MTDTSPPTFTDTSLPTSTLSSTDPPKPFSSSSYLLTVKLTHDNFLLWKAQIMPYLRGKYLFGYVDGTIYVALVFDEISS